VATVRSAANINVNLNGCFAPQDANGLLALQQESLLPIPTDPVTGANLPLGAAWRVGGVPPDEFTITHVGLGENVVEQNAIAITFTTPGTAQSQELVAWAAKDAKYMPGDLNPSGAGARCAYWDPSQVQGNTVTICCVLDAGGRACCFPKGLASVATARAAATTYASLVGCGLTETLNGLMLLQSQSLLPTQRDPKTGAMLPAGSAWAVSCGPTDGFTAEAIGLGQVGGRNGVAITYVTPGPAYSQDLIASVNHDPEFLPGVPTPGGGPWVCASADPTQIAQGDVIICFYLDDATWCNSTCVDLESDSQNCGACGVVCPTGQICSAKACITGAACNVDGDCGTGQHRVVGACH
jgi:hypothetical protein